jgi:hypothetical protein
MPDALSSDYIRFSIAEEAVASVRIAAIYLSDLKFMAPPDLNLSEVVKSC